MSSIHSVVCSVLRTSTFGADVDRVAVREGNDNSINDKTNSNNNRGNKNNNSSNSSWQQYLQSLPSAGADNPGRGQKGPYFCKLHPPCMQVAQAGVAASCSGAPPVNNSTHKNSAGCAVGPVVVNIRKKHVLS